MKKIIQACLASFLLLTFFTGAASAGTDEVLITDLRFLTAEAGFYTEAIQELLEVLGSPLADYSEEVGGNSMSAAESIWIASQHQDFGMSPKTLIALLDMEGNLDKTPDFAFTLHVQDMFNSLWGYYTSWQQGVHDVELPNNEVISIDESLNAGTYAVMQYLADLSYGEDVFNQRLSDWNETYTRIFGVDPKHELSSPKTAPDILPFLQLPFEQPEGSFIKISSFLDHAQPSIYDDSILRFDGLTLSPASFSTCILGVTCYGGHNGVDYATGEGLPIYAAADGEVIYKYYNTDESQGNVDSGLYIDHGNGYRTAYWHMDPILVDYGDVVEKGQLIGMSGNIGMSSGPHLHFGLRLTTGNKSVDPYGWWSTLKSDPWGDSNWMWEGDLTADNLEAQSQLFYRSYWYADVNGYDGGSFWTYGMVNPEDSTNWGMWGTFIETPGRYNVYAYWPQYDVNTRSAQYQIFHAGGSTVITADQSADGDRFVLLGTFEFERGDTVVMLRDNTNDSGRRLYYDAIKWEPEDGTIPSPTPDVETLTEGKYNENHTLINYSPAWQVYEGTGPYENTLAYSTEPGNEVSFSFSGSQFAVDYTSYPNRGTLTVYVDNVQVSTINQYGPFLNWQSRWTSPVMENGQHTVKLVHADGSHVDLDAVEIYANENILGAGTWDDTGTRLAYDGDWFGYSGSGPVQDTLHYSNTIGDTVTFTIEGTGFNLYYAGYPNRGVMKIYVDGELISTLNQYSAFLNWRTVWESPALQDGQHEIVLEHFSGSVVDLDAVIVEAGSQPDPTNTPTATQTSTQTQTPTVTVTPTVTTTPEESPTDTPTPTQTQTPTSTPAVILLEEGTYDETAAGIDFSTNWDLLSDDSAYQDAYTQSDSAGDKVTLTFNGNQFTLIYTGDVNFGTMDILVDGQVIDTLNQKTETLSYQNYWYSGILSNGPHELTLRNAVGGLVNLDGIIISQLFTGAQYIVQPNMPIYISNFVHPDQGDSWMGVAGQIFDRDGNPVENAVVIVEGVLNGQPVEQLGLSGLDFGYGPGGYEIMLAQEPIASYGTLLLTVYDLGGNVLSSPFYFDTFADPERNLVIINFVLLD